MKKLISYLLVLLTVTSQAYAQEASVINGSVEAPAGEIIVTTVEKAQSEFRADVSRYMDQNSNGDQLVALYRRKINDKWDIIARLESINRFNQDDQKVGAGVVYHMDKKNIRVEFTQGAKNTLYANDSVEAEYVTPLTDKLVGYAALRYSDYNQAQLSNYLASLATEYYFGKKSMIYSRVFYSYDNYSVSNDFDSVSGLVKYVYFINDNNRVWGYLANGSEGTLNPNTKSLSIIKDDVIGIGGSYQINQNTSLEANLERRERRSNSQDSYIFMVSIVRKW